VTIDLPINNTPDHTPIKRDIPGNRCAGCVPNSFIIQYLGRPAHDGFQGHLSEMATTQPSGSPEHVEEWFGLNASIDLQCRAISLNTSRVASESFCLRSN
jgi:hypothetical protein